MEAENRIESQKKIIDDFNAKFEQVIKENKLQLLQSNNTISELENNLQEAKSNTESQATKYDLIISDLKSKLENVEFQRLQDKNILEKDIAQQKEIFDKKEKMASAKLDVLKNELLDERKNIENLQLKMKIVEQELIDCFKRTHFFGNDESN